MIYRDYIKRVLDFVFALLLLILLSPLLLVVTIWLYFANKGAGAFFTQERPGKDEKIFKLYKFKSMTDERDAELIIEKNGFGKWCPADSTDSFSKAVDLFIANSDQLPKWGASGHRYMLDHYTHEVAYNTIMSHFPAL